ncbi:MAG: hypothetical protein QNK05_10450 [Myxococcota bacterium]|nr:hypothetical protein [Myxococcota bacterium]
MKTAITLLGIAGFAGFLVWFALQGGSASCEVCMESGGRVHCSTVAAPTVEEAEMRGRLTACGVIAGAMDAELACQRGPARSVRCEP